jgi:catechol 2,3-dioxygenase-like lactoylglutathione lyase family enzyme
MTVLTGVHHVDLVVSDLTRSLPFYRELLQPLGYTRVGNVVGERGETIHYLAGDPQLQ